MSKLFLATSLQFCSQKLSVLVVHLRSNGGGCASAPSSAPTRQPDGQEDEEEDDDDGDGYKAWLGEGGEGVWRKEGGVEGPWAMGGGR